MGMEGRLTYHFTGCADLSSTTFTVVHENRTNEGNPKVRSKEWTIHSFVFGSKIIYK